MTVVPYVPSSELVHLPRDTFAFESTLAYDGGDDGTATLRRVVVEAPRYLRPGGTLLLELGGEQAHTLAEELERQGFDAAETFVDEDGDLRGLQATWRGIEA